MLVRDCVICTDGRAHLLSRDVWITVCRFGIVDLCDAFRYTDLGDLKLPLLASQPVNAGVLYDFQMVNVEDYQGQGEFSPTPFFYQNLGEAEYIVAFYVSCKTVLNSGEGHNQTRYAATCADVSATLRLAG